jgi:hypothetical protein
MRDSRSAALEAESFELKCGALWVMDNGTETMSLLFCLLSTGYWLLYSVFCLLDSVFCELPSPCRQLDS